MGIKLSILTKKTFSASARVGKAARWSTCRPRSSTTRREFAFGNSVLLIKSAASHAWSHKRNATHPSPTESSGDDSGVSEVCVCRVSVRICMNRYYSCTQMRGVKKAFSLKLAAPCATMITPNWIAPTLLCKTKTLKLLNNETFQSN